MVGPPPAEGSPVHPEEVIPQKGPETLALKVPPQKTEKGHR